MHYNFIISIYVTDNQFCNSLSTVYHDKKVTDTLFNQRTRSFPIRKPISANTYYQHDQQESRYLWTSFYIRHLSRSLTANYIISEMIIMMMADSGTVICAPDISSPRHHAAIATFEWNPKYSSFAIFTADKHKSSSSTFNIFMSPSQLK